MKIITGNDYYIFFDLLHLTDNEKPVIVGCPSDIVNSTDVGAATGNVTWTPPTVTDNSGLVTLTSSHNTTDSFPIGTTEINYTAVDGAGNMADVCRFNITITGKLKHYFSCLLKFFLLVFVGVVEKITPVNPTCVIHDIS